MDNKWILPIVLTSLIAWGTFITSQVYDMRAKMDSNYREVSRIQDELKSLKNEFNGIMIEIAHSSVKARIKGNKGLNSEDPNQHNYCLYYISSRRLSRV